MAGKRDTWRLDYFAAHEDKIPSRSEVIAAIDENDAADQAESKMQGDLRVDVTRTILKNSN